jgi:hypothetical protein
MYVIQRWWSISSEKVALSFSLLAGRVGSNVGRGDVSWPNLTSGEKVRKGSVISSSGLVQLPPRDMKDSMLPRDEKDESEKPDDDVGLLEDSLWLDWSISDQCWGPSKLMMVLIWATGVFGGDSMRV